MFTVQGRHPYPCPIALLSTPDSPVPSRPTALSLTLFGPSGMVHQPPGAYRFLWRTFFSDSFPSLPIAPLDPDSQPTPSEPVFCPAHTPPARYLSPCLVRKPPRRSTHPSDFGRSPRFSQSVSRHDIHSQHQARAPFFYLYPQEQGVLLIRLFRRR